MQKPRFQGTTKATEFPEKRKRRTTTPTTIPTTKRHTTATERTRSSTKPRMHTESFVCASVPSFHTPENHPPSFHTRHEPRFLRTQMSLSSFHIPTKAPPKFHKSTKPKYPPMQNDLSKFHHGKKGKGFRISITTPRNDPPLESLTSSRNATNHHAPHKAFWVSIQTTNNHTRTQHRPPQTPPTKG